MSNEARVYLDHLIDRQSLRYSPTTKSESSYNNSSSQRSDHSIRFDDIRQQDGWFTRLVKPDFQRATCAWSPEGCVNFLSSVIRRRIIPSIILWRNDETGLVYVLDGAHRLSALRAWMLDDWGDKAGEFYEKNENYNEILSTAAETRLLVKEQIGSFEEYSEAEKEWRKISFDGEAPKKIMSEKRFEMARFYSDITSSSRTLHAQWESGDYEAAEESFLAINRQGAPLDDLESTLIEFRKGSFARVIMSIANNGASGHYWPTPNSSDSLSKELTDKIATFNHRCGELHNIFFVPPFDSKVLDINVPFMVAPGHFRKHQHLIELLPLLVERTAINKENINDILRKDYLSGPSEIIINADTIISTLEERAAHLGNRNHSSHSLSLVPLIYWYNKQGSYVRALFYGLCQWLFSGTPEEIKIRKIALSSVRGELETTLINHKDDYSEIQHRGGAGLKSTTRIADTVHKLIQTLLENRNSPKDVLDIKIKELLGSKHKLSSKTKTGRAFTTKSKAEINIREMLLSSVKCQICDGIVDLKQGVQYDHIDHWAVGKNSSPDNGRPTHPFCNLFREHIQDLRSGTRDIELPKSSTDITTEFGTQLTLFDSFPGQG